MSKNSTEVKRYRRKPSFNEWSAPPMPASEFYKEENNELKKKRIGEDISLRGGSYKKSNRRRSSKKQNKKSAKEIDFVSKVKLKQGLKSLICWRKNHIDKVNNH